MTYLLFLDESGDHGLKKIDTGFPVFVLGGVLMETTAYEEVSEKTNGLKNRFWGSTDIVFHSRDIRKQEKAFSILSNADRRKEFYESLNALFQSSDFQVFATVVDKPEYLTAFGTLIDDIYKVALSQIVEQVLLYLNRAAGDRTDPKSLKIILEKRGKKEDRSLAAYFQKLLSLGTGRFSKKELDQWNIEFDFEDKKENTVGLQLADLGIYPIARLALEKTGANPAFEVLKPKIDPEHGLRRLP